MNRKGRRILIRDATVEDASLICSWWNDGKVMAHAGFPNGLGTSEDRIIRQIESESDDTSCLHIIEYYGVPIGEMNYRNIGDGVCEIGIKICESEYQNKGIGKQILSLFIDGLFHDRHYRKVVLDTNLNNTRAQHMYEQLGFHKIRTNKDAWIDQLGNPQTSIDFELIQEWFVSFPEV